MSLQETDPAVPTAATNDDPPKTFTVATRKSQLPLKISNQIPDDILLNPLLNQAISTLLPANYNFEIHKTIWQIRKASAKTIALQFPEGLLIYSCPISDILEEFALVDTVILSDVTYGACCVDDFTAVKLGCDFLVHYGHSCLIPINQTKIKCLYVFVEIDFDSSHLVQIIKENFEETKKLALVATVQFIATLNKLKSALSNYTLIIPQIRPLSHGEILGCTAPRIQNSDALIYVADGRFHLEAVMIANPSLPAYKYDPYSKKMTREYYDIDLMHSVRKSAIENSKSAKHFGLILGTLGRQGSLSVLRNIERRIRAKNRECTIVLLSELSPQKLALFTGIDAWIQVACPRLSIDWGYAFDKPLLSPYEASVVLEAIEWQQVYPMDYYAKDGLGDWTVYKSSQPPPK